MHCDPDSSVQVGCVGTEEGVTGRYQVHPRSHGGPKTCTVREKGEEVDRDSGRSSVGPSLQRWSPFPSHLDGQGKRHEGVSRNKDGTILVSNPRRY